MVKRLFAEPTPPFAPAGAGGRARELSQTSVEGAEVALQTNLERFVLN